METIAIAINRLSQVFYAEGSFEGLGASERQLSHRYVWVFDLEEDSECVADVDGEEIVPFVESSIHVKFATARINLLELLSSSAQLAASGPAALRDVLADMGLETTEVAFAEDWEKEVLLSFRGMYAQLLKGISDTSRPREDARNAEEELMACLRVSRRLWTRIRSVVFTNTEADVVSAVETASPSIGGFAKV